MSVHHPSSELIKQFAEASLDGALLGVISAHIEHCSICRKAARDLEQTLSLDALNSSSQISSTQISEAWEKILSRLGSSKSQKVGLVPECVVQIDGMKFVLPRALRNFALKPIKWISFGKGGKISKLGHEKGRSLFLIYLFSHEEVPLHSHAGMEHSYVISGSYAADGAVFETGDFSSSMTSVTHAPRAGSEGGCLILSSVEKRLNFLHGWLSPFNCLLWWALNVRIKWMQRGGGMLKLAFICALTFFVTSLTSGSIPGLTLTGLRKKVTASSKWYADSQDQSSNLKRDNYLHL